MLERNEITFQAIYQSARISHFQAGETIINAEKWTLWNTENRKREGSRSSGSRWLWSPGRMFWVVCKSHFQKKKKCSASWSRGGVSFVCLSVCLSARPGRVLLILLCLIDRAHRPIGIAASKQYHLFRPELWSNERAFSLLSAYDSHSGGGEAAGQLKDLHQIRRVTKSPRCPGHVASLFCFSV